MARGAREIGWRAWGYLSAGAAAVCGLTLVPGTPFTAGRWPLGGPFGLFTWTAWSVSTALAVALFLLAGSLAWRARAPHGSRSARRVMWGGVGFGLLAASAFSAAARADLIERHPWPRSGWRSPRRPHCRVVFAVAPGGPRRPHPDQETGPEAKNAAGPGGPNRTPAPPARRVRREGRPGDPDEPEDGDPREADDAATRWSRRLATAMAVMLVLFVAAGTAVRWLGPGLGLVLTLQSPAPIFWEESAFFEYETKARAKSDLSAYLKPPPQGSPEAARRGVIGPGTKLAIKGWVEGGPRSASRPTRTDASSASGVTSASRTSPSKRAPETQRKEAG
ncbi:MAG: hypothetical protein U0835_16425 [Isosphaeraceae bacterium]